MKTRRTLFIIFTALSILALAVITYLLLARPDTQSSNTTTPPTQTNQPNGTDTAPSDQEESVSIPVKVYFSKHPESDDDPSKTFPVNRTATDRGVGRYVIEQLLAGPTPAEQAAGYFSMVRIREGTSNCNDRDFTLVIKDGVATVKFCRTFDALGTVSDGQAKSAITDSLLQFASIEKVIILTPEGHCQFDMSGEDRCLQ